AMNLLLAFVIVWALFLSNGQSVTTKRVLAVQNGSPAAKVLKPGDRIVAVDGGSGSPIALRNQIGTHRCAGTQVNGCLAATPARVVVDRRGRPVAFEITPRYSSADHRPLLGFEFDEGQK